MTQEPKIFPYIAKLLNGEKVQWKTLGEVCKILRGKRLTKKELSDEGKYPVFHGGLIPLGYYNSYNRRGNQTMVINTGSIGEVVWSGVDFWSSDGTFVVETNDVIEDKFLYYYLKTKEQYLKNQKREGGVPTIDRSVVEKIPIPLPPLSVQQEIVRILDKFTQLEAELEAELDCRKRQYEYYRNALLSFDDLENRGGYNSLINNKIQYKTLGEVFNLKNGYTPSKANKEYWENGTIPWFRMEDIRINGRILNDAIQKVSKSAVKGERLFPADSIMLSTTATIGEHALIQVSYLSNQQLTNFSLKENFLGKVNIKYVFYYFFLIGEELKKMGNDATLKIVAIKKLEKIQIPLPPIEEQERIVAILDKFDTLVNSISEGLPKEIQQRRQQYEYYREQLLTF